MVRDGAIVVGRSCGDCTACCTVFRVPELQKKAGVDCRHLTKKGCGIHATRPPVCRHYECLWLQGMLLDIDAPNILGVIFSMPAPGNELERAGITSIVAEEYRDGSFASERFKTIARIIATEAVLILKKGDRRTVLGPQPWLDQACEILIDITKGGL